MPQEDPVSLRRAAQVRVRDQKKIVEMLDDRIGRIKAARSSWESELATVYEKRYGMRDPVDFPWPDAANVHLGLCDKQIRRLKAAFVRLVFGAVPIVTISAQDRTMAYRVEHFFDWMLRSKMDIRVPLNMIADSMLAFGKGICKVTWNKEVRVVTDKFSVAEIFGIEDNREILRADPPLIHARLAAAFDLNPMDPDDVETILGLVNDLREGAKALSVRHNITIHDEPQLTSVHPINFYGPVGMREIENASFFAHRMHVPTNQLKARQKAGFYKNVNAVIEHAENTPDERRIEELTTQSEYREDVAEGTYDHGDTVEIYECYWLYDVNRDGVKERVVTTIHRPTGKILRFVEYPYAHGQWPFTIFDYEITDGRFYSSRGIVDLLRDIQDEINIQHSNKINSMTITTAPIGFYARASGLQPEDIDWTPGQMIPTNNPHQDVNFPLIPAHDISYEREEQILKTWAEELSGLMDSGITRSTSAVQGRTATEVEAIQTENATVFSLDAENWQGNMRRVYEQIIGLWQQYGPDEVEIAVIGEDLPIKVSRQDIAGRYDVIPTGTPTNTTLSYRMGRAIQFFDIVSRMPERPANLSYDELTRWIAQMLDPEMAKRVVRQGAMSGAELEAEKQLDEIARMVAIPGYQAPVSPSDVHQIHAQIIEQTIQQGGEAFAASDAGQRVFAHGLKHQEYLQRGRSANLDELGNPVDRELDAGRIMSASMEGGGR